MSIKEMTRVWEESEQSGTKLNLLLCIADHANDDGIAFPGQERLAHRIRVKKTQTVSDHVDGLVKAGELFYIQPEGYVIHYAVLSGCDAAEQERRKGLLAEVVAGKYKDISLLTPDALLRGTPTETGGGGPTDSDGGPPPKPVGDPSVNRQVNQPLVADATAGPNGTPSSPLPVPEKTPVDEPPLFDQYKNVLVKAHYNLSYPADAAQITANQWGFAQRRAKWWMGNDPHADPQPPIHEGPRQVAKFYADWKATHPGMTAPEVYDTIQKEWAKWEAEIAQAPVPSGPRTLSLVEEGETV